MGRTLMLLAVLALAAVISPKPEISYDPSLFHAPDPVMARGEAKFAEIFKTTGNLGLIDFGAWQRDNAALKRKLGPVPRSEYLSRRDLPSGLVLSLKGSDYLVLPEAVAKELSPDCERVNLKVLLKELFETMTGRTVRVIACSVVVLLLLALGILRRRALEVALPPLCSVLATYLTLGFLGEPLTFFHILSFFIILGLGLDYAIFRNRIVFYSFLTSLLGFGLLAFTSFPPTAAIGKTLAIGLSYAYLFSLVRMSSPASTPASASSWATQKEQAAGRLRLWLTFALYRYLGKDFCKLCAVFVVASAYPGFRRRCTFRKALSFAFGLLDKLDACTLRKNFPKMTVVGDTGWMKGGAFLLSTHVGTIEVLPALTSRPSTDDLRPPVVHAFQQLTHNKLFTEMFLKHFDKRQFVLHPVEEIGVETAVEMQEAIARGEMVLMAGDRAPASGGKKGVFKFAKLMEAPVYAITCVRTGWNAYTVNAKELNRKAIQADYEAFLAEAIATYPSEHFEF